MELERQENILIFGHQAILRCLYVFFPPSYTEAFADFSYFQKVRIFSQFASDRPAIHQNTIAHRHQTDPESLWLRRGKVCKHISTLLNVLKDLGYFRYALPIGAVDTHRPKPKGPTPTVQIKTGREYFTDHRAGLEEELVPVTIGGAQTTL